MTFSCEHCGNNLKSISSLNLHKKLIKNVLIHVTLI